MNTLITKRIKLVPANENHFETLYEWRNDISELYLWQSQKVIIPKHEYWSELKSDFNNGIIRLIIIEITTNQIIGQIFSYNPSTQNGYVSVGLFLIKEKRFRYYGIEAMAIFVKYLFDYLNVHKVYFEVFGFNKHSFSILSKIGFELEARLNEHILYSGERWPLFKFALYSKNIPEIQRILDRFIIH